MKLGKSPIRVLVVEDSPTVRQLLVTLLREDGFDVVGECETGHEAVEAATRLRPDLITMDVHLPGLDGLEATREIMASVPTPIVIVSGAIAPSDVDAALTATRAGALMVVPKPGDPRADDFPQRRDEFLAMARAMAGVRVVRRWGSTRTSRITPRAPGTTSPARQAPVAPRLVAIGTSTGGPAALERILTDLPADFALPVLVVQHMAHGFTRGLADWLAHNTGRRIIIAAGGEAVRGGVVYVAPDDQHLGISSAGRITLSDGAPRGGFRPSVDSLFESCARAYGASLVAVILTGMGQDGVAGLRAVKLSSGYVIGQDESSSVVFGMARAAIGEGLVDEVVPIDAIGARLGALAAAGNGA